MLDNKDLYDYFKSNRAGVVLIGGSGILSKDLADSGNIINSHPAYLPYVRGLDSLKWTIYHNKPIGVTTHFISNECDAGRLIRRELVPLYSWDTFHSVANRQYEMEVDMLVDSLQDISTASLEELSTQESSVMRRMPHSNEMRLMKRFQKIIDNVEVIK
jgi:phosphoribosylglycinamide formyltransferase-1